MARDQQRQRLYDAEQHLRKTEPGKVLGNGDLAAAQRYVDRAIARAGEHTDRFIGTQPQIFSYTPTVTLKKGSPDKAWYRPGTQQIQLPVGARAKWAWHGLPITHEVAHHLTLRDLPDHGPVFAHNFVELVALTESRKLANLLTERFDAGGVLHGADAAIERAVKYARKVHAEAWGAYSRGETGDDETARVSVHTFDGEVFHGWLISAEEDGVEVRVGSRNVTITRPNLAEVVQQGRYYRP